MSHGDGALDSQVFVNPHPEALRAILAQAGTPPADHLCRRLEVDDGASWFEHVIDGAMTAVERAEPTGRSRADLPIALKQLGKRKLQEARLTEEIEEATAIYFAAVVQLLARSNVGSLADVCSLPATVVEDVFVTFQERLQGQWPHLVERAMRFID